jgi:protoporphyrinogen oxidase
MGGHVIFSHYSYFDDLLDRAVGSDGWEYHQRVSYVWLKDRWVPYPFQNNLYCLDEDDKVDCISGLIDAYSTRSESKPRNFDEWIVRNMGLGIANLFMRPYNFKVWAYPPDAMQCEWLGERVALVDLKKVTENVMRNKPDAGWGPNAQFRFPKQGGTGSIWKHVAEILPENKLFFNKRITEIDFEKKTVTFSDGPTCIYNKLLTTSPLHQTLTWIGRPDLAAHLKYSSTHIIGLSLRGKSPHDKKCWMYYPEANCPFYRCTVFSHYAEGNCPPSDNQLPTIRRADGDPCFVKEPQSGPYWSLMFEVSESEVKPVGRPEDVLRETIHGAINTKLIAPDTEIVSIFYKRLELGYPTPSLDRDKGVTEGLRILREKDVWSRGRFGAWKYEIGNQDHSLMQGVEAADNMLFGSVEMTLEFPNIVNNRRNNNLRYTKK